MTESCDTKSWGKWCYSTRWLVERENSVNQTVNSQLPNLSILYISHPQIISTTVTRWAFNK